jgi:D-alanine-D-alanine ligase
MDDYDPTWWQHIFDETYLVTDARSVCCPEVTATEVDMVEATLGLGADDLILDLCGGQGRHAIELTRRGYRNVMVFDYSQVLLEVGSHDATKVGSSVHFCRGDACRVGLADDSFDVVLVMGNSFGYFKEDSQNKEILREIRRLLKPGGKVLLDLIHSDYARAHFKPSSWHEANEDIVVCRERELQNEGVLVREIVLSKERGLIRDVRYFARLFQPQDMEALLTECGFQHLDCGGLLVSHPKADDYGLLNKRMLVTAFKP